MFFLAGKVNAGLAESNDSLPLGDDLKSHLPVHRDQLRAQRSVTRTSLFTSLW